MKRTDLEKMTEKELRDLNKLVVAEINEKLRQKAAEESRKFSLNDHVTFTHQGRAQFGHVTSINQKSISILEETGSRRWRVSPSLLSHVTP